MLRSIIVYVDYHMFLAIEANGNFVFVFKRRKSKL